VPKICGNLTLLSAGIDASGNGLRGTARADATTAATGTGTGTS
jgi:hypothetical protein